MIYLPYWARNPHPLTEERLAEREARRAAKRAKQKVRAVQRRKPLNKSQRPSLVLRVKRLFKPAPVDDAPIDPFPDKRHDKWLHSAARARRRLLWADLHPTERYPFDSKELLTKGGYQ